MSLSYWYVAFHSSFDAVNIFLLFKFHVCLWLPNFHPLELRLLIDLLDYHIAYLKKRKTNTKGHTSWLGSTGSLVFENYSNLHKN